MPRDRSPNFPGDQHVRSFISRVTVRSKVWLEVQGDFAIGEGGIDLLKAIAAKGSLAAAARHMGWSYRHAWGYLRRAEKVIGVSFTMARAGKGVARGAILTPSARRLIKDFDANCARGGRRRKVPGVG